MDKIFANQIGKNIKVCVDDMVIKSHSKEILLHDEEETFKMLPKAQMRLNQAKCTFGVMEGQFLRRKHSQRSEEEITQIKVRLGG